jgi:beta-phosphoglucomutase
MAEFVAPRAVIFDMDGVLTDSEPLINEAAVTMFRELGMAVAPDDFTPFVGTGEDRYLGGVAEKHQVTIDLPAAKRRTYEIYLGLVTRRLRAFPGACELVHRSKEAGLKVALASSADRIKIDANLRQIGLPPEVWDAIVTGDDVENKKPAPDLFLLAADRLGVEPSQCVVIEDAPNGIEAARAAGMRCVGVAQTFPGDRLGSADLVRPTVRMVDLTDLVGAGRSLVSPEELGRAGAADPVRAAEGGVRGPWGFWVTLGMSLLIVGGVVLVELALGVVLAVVLASVDRLDRLEELVSETSGFLWAVGTLVATPVVVGMVVLFAWARRGMSVRDYLGLRRVHRGRLIRWCLALLTFAVLADLTAIWLGRPVVPEVMLEAYRSAGWTPLLWVAVVVCAPIGEELFFRGFLFKGWMHSALGGWGTVAMTSLIWAVIHQQYDLHGMGIIFAVGLLLGYSRLRSGSIHPAIVMHALMNLLATVQTAAYIRFAG